MYPAPDHLSIVFVYGALISIAASSMSLNYRKNGVLNLSLPGLMYVGALVSSALVRVFQMSPYWGLLFCVFFGGFVNLLLNNMFGVLSKRDSFMLVTLASFIGYLVLHGGGWFVFSSIRSLSAYYLMIPHLMDYDFTLFNIPGVLLITTAWLVFQTIIHYIIEPAVTTKISNRWNTLVYFLAGASACTAGVLFSVWFHVGMTSTLLVLIVVGVSLFSGLSGIREPVFGGLFLSWLLIWLTQLTQSSIGAWTGDYQFIVPCLYILVSIPFFPDGILGSLLKKLSYKG